jgi:predicted nuclease of predicted toxin-antitoxin system
MLRFLTDEDFDGRLTSALLARVPGLDLVRTQDTGLMHTPDPDILAWAAAEGRIELTHDRNTMTGFDAELGGMSGEVAEKGMCDGK